MRLHQCSVCVPFVRNREEIVADDDMDWNMALVCLGRLWRQKMEQRKELSELRITFLIIEWIVLHLKQTLYNVDGEEFVHASCKGDRAAIVFRVRKESDSKWKEMGHMYYAMGIPHEHNLQCVVLATCNGLWVAKSLVEVFLETKWVTTPILVGSSGSSEADQALMRMWNQTPSGFSFGTTPDMYLESINLEDFKNWLEKLQRVYDGVHDDCEMAEKIVNIERIL